jgi:signal peptidase I
LALVAAGMLVGLHTYIVFPVRICGSSMSPVLQDGQLCWVDRQAYLSKEPQRGDIICFETDDELVVKRVIGLPGESISICNGAVQVDGEPLREPYLKVAASFGAAAQGLVRGQCYAVLGDNRSQCMSENMVLLVHRERIIGRVAVSKERLQITVPSLSEDGKSPLSHK